MRLSEPIKPRRSVGLTPLIDVVFLLLVFFMLATTFSKYGTVELETAGAGSGATVRPEKMLLVHVGEAGALQLNGQAIEPDALLVEIERRVGDGAEDAVIVARSTAKVTDLIAAVRLVRGSAAKTVRVVN